MSHPVWAEITVEVSGNGNGTNNSVAVESSQTTTVSQSNTANVSSDVHQEANTGDNQANANSGNTQISTGDVTTSTTVTSNVNNSVVNVDNCCAGQGITVTVSGNGADSTNSVKVGVGQNVSVSIDQTANVNNQVSLTADSGHNQASGNSGSVSITTGDIASVGYIRNGINNADVNIASGRADVLIKNKNNGAGSINPITISLYDMIEVNKTDIANIANLVIAHLYTGNNFADDNSGDVTIQTGQASLAFSIINDPVNTDKVVIDYCCKEEENPPPTPPPPSPPPVVPPGNGGNGGNGNGDSSSSGGGGGNNLAAAIGEVLPATGSDALHFWILAVVYLLIFLAGLYLRLRAGRSPSQRLHYCYA